MSEVVLICKNVEDGKTEHAGDVDAQGREKEKKISVISASYAVVHPGTMVIEYLNKNKFKKINFQAVAAWNQFKLNNIFSNCLVNKMPKWHIMTPSM